MAKINITICDLCQKIEKQSLKSKVTLQLGAGKDKEVRRGDICRKCYDKLVAQLDKEFNPEQVMSSNSHGEAIVPAKLDNVARQNGPVKCTHSNNNSYEHPYVICNDCGEKWHAK